MPKLILQYEGRVLREYPIGQVLTIGRLPGNTIVIDNPARKVTDEAAAAA